LAPGIRVLRRDEAVVAVVAVIDQDDGQFHPAAVSLGDRCALAVLLPADPRRSIHVSGSAVSSHSASSG
jgi:hypothetical protein